MKDKTVILSVIFATVVMGCTGQTRLDFTRGVIECATEAFINTQTNNGDSTALVTESPILVLNKEAILKNLAADLAKVTANTGSCKERLLNDAIESGKTELINTLSKSTVIIPAQ